MYKDLSDGEFLCQGDVEDILATLSIRPMTYFDVRRFVCAVYCCDTRAKPFIDQINECVRRGFVVRKGDVLTLILAQD